MFASSDTAVGANHCAKESADEARDILDHAWPHRHFFSPGCASSVPKQEAGLQIPKASRLTVLYDAFGQTPRCSATGDTRPRRDWRRRILFDTGNSAEVLARNTIFSGGARCSTAVPAAVLGPCGEVLAVGAETPKPLWRVIRPSRSVRADTSSTHVIAVTMDIRRSRGGQVDPLPWCSCRLRRCAVSNRIALPPVSTSAGVSQSPLHRGVLAECGVTRPSFEMLGICRPALCFGTCWRTRQKKGGAPGQWSGCLCAYLRFPFAASDSLRRQCPRWRTLRPQK